MEEPVRIDQCNSIKDFRLMARRRLPGPIFHYIDGAADDEVTYRRNTEAYERKNQRFPKGGGLPGAPCATRGSPYPCHRPVERHPFAIQTMTPKISI